MVGVGIGTDTMRIIGDRCLFKTPIGAEFGGYLAHIQVNVKFKSPEVQAGNRTLKSYLSSVLVYNLVEP